MNNLTLTPTDFRDYAKSIGWTILPEAIQDRIYVFHNETFPRRQITIPMDDTASDYCDAISIAVGKISELHKISVQKIIVSIQALHDDTIRVGVASERSNDKTIPLSFASSLIQSAQQMLLSSACTVLKPQAYHPRLTRSEAQQLIEHTRFGHTEPGSFVLKISCPVNAMDIQGFLPDGPSMPFVRRTTLALKKGLRSLVDSLETDTLDTLVDRVKSEPTPILSSNLCEAVTRLYDNEIRNKINLSFSWAIGYQLPAEDMGSDAIKIQPDYFPRIEEVRRELRAVERHRDDTFIGTVESLDGEMSDDGRRSGNVTIQLLLRDGEAVRARVSLSADEYDQALVAHKTNGAYIQITGRLFPGRQPRTLSNISHFTAITPQG